MSWNLFCAVIAGSLGLVSIGIVLWPTRPRFPTRPGPNRKLAIVRTHPSPPERSTGI